MAARDPDSGEGLGDKQLTDELITFLIAGHGMSSFNHNDFLFVQALSNLPIPFFSPHNNRNDCGLPGIYFLFDFKTSWCGKETVGGDRWSIWGGWTPHIRKDSTAQISNSRHERKHAVNSSPTTYQFIHKRSSFSFTPHYIGYIPQWLCRLQG